MDAIVIAGGTPQPDDPLYAYSQGKPKALIDIAGRPMIVWVLDALNQAKTVDDLIVVGIDDPADQQTVQIAINGPITFLPNTGGLVSNGLAGLDFVYQKHNQHVPVIGCSSDIPHMRAHMVDDLVDRCRPFDQILYYAAVTPEIMSAAYPNAQRTFTNLAGKKLAGADIFVSNTRLLDTNRELWRKVINARKNPLQMAWAIGLWPLFKLATGRMSVDDAAQLAGQRLEHDRPIGVIYTRYAELAMDGDKPHQIEILRKGAGSE
ncbi:MAG: GTP:adenosylcobinamide-phosphate guanylyltransferase [Cellvibrionaceae bacterium]|jgi:GTP:adenosylcobinamide-phosphate guanylyltransferase